MTLSIKKLFFKNFPLYGLCLAAVLLMVWVLFKNRDNNTQVPVKTENSSSVQIQNNIPVQKSDTDYLSLHYSSIVTDSHNDFIWKVFDKGADIGGTSFTQTDIPRFKQGGLDVQVFAVWIPMSRLKSSYSFAVSQIERLKQFPVNYPADIEFASNYADVIRIVDSKKLCGLIGIEGGTVIGNDLDNINRLYDMGVRYIGLTWNNSNNIASSAKDESSGRQGGLTEFGFEVIKRMDEVGMMIDVSHLGEQSFWDMAKTTKNPILASHSNCYSINPHYRNLTDEQIKAIAKSGGVIDVNFYDQFLDKDYMSGGTTIEKVIEHIDYIKNLVGIDYVGIGSDFDGGITPPKGLADATQYPEITRLLMERGYTNDEIRKVLGLNFLRVFKQVCG